MHSLIITAHPSSRGRTHKIAKVYAQTKEANGDTARIVDLYEPVWHQDFLRFEDVRTDIPIEGVRQEMQEMITAADEIVLVAPIWWMSVPAIMKNFFDSTLTSGFAFRYGENGRPEGLLKGRSARLFFTAGGPGVIYKFLGSLFLMPITIGVFRFCGISVASKDIFADRDTSKGKVSDEEMIEVVRRRAL